MSFQSQVGREEWLRPYTDETLVKMAREGQRRVSVVCPGFATDCLETLEEIAIRNRAPFMTNGGEFYDYIPALNAGEAHAEVARRAHRTARACLVSRRNRGPRTTWKSHGGARCARVPRASADRRLLSAPIGRFLEISIHTDVIQESLEFYQSLGFVQANVGETWPYPYAVVTDGRLFIGLHGAVVRSPALTFVLPQLARGIEGLKQRGIDFDQERLGNDVFNQATFTDPNGISVNVLEARTFSPPHVEAAIATTCGYFSEFGIPVRDPAAPLVTSGNRWVSSRSRKRRSLSRGPPSPATCSTLPCTARDPCASPCSLSRIRTCASD